MMNERIEQLARLATNNMLSYDAEGEWRLSQKEAEKFAELIIISILDEVRTELHREFDWVGYDWEMADIITARVNQIFGVE
jgi:hypothetical protein